MGLSLLPDREGDVQRLWRSAVGKAGLLHRLVKGRRPYVHAIPWPPTLDVDGEMWPETGGGFVRIPPLIRDESSSADLLVDIVVRVAKDPRRWLLLLDQRREIRHERW